MIVNQNLPARIVAKGHMILAPPRPRASCISQKAQPPQNMIVQDCALETVSPPALFGGDHLVEEELNVEIHPVRRVIVERKVLVGECRYNMDMQGRQQFDAWSHGSVMRGQLDVVEVLADLSWRQRRRWGCGRVCIMADALLVRGRMEW